MKKNSAVRNDRAAQKEEKSNEKEKFEKRNEPGIDGVYGGWSSGRMRRRR